MVDPAVVYFSGVVLLFFFWIYGIVAFLRDVKNTLVPAYRQWRRSDRNRALREEDPAVDNDPEGERPHSPDRTRE